MSSRFEGSRLPETLGPALLIGVTAYQLIVLAVWLRLDLRPPRHDESILLTMSLHSFEHLRSGELIEALRTFQVANTKTGLVSFLAALSYFAFGTSYRIAIFVINGLSLAIIALSMGVMARRLYGGVLVGAAAFCFLLSGHLIAAWSHFFIVDLTLTAFVSLTLAAMVEIRMRAFKRSSWLAVLAVALVLGIPTKHLFVGFVAAPLAFLFFDYLLRDPNPLAVRIRRASLVAGVGISAGMVGLCYHALNWPVVQEMWLRSKDSALTGGAGEPPSLMVLLGQLNFDMFYGFAIYALVPGLLALLLRQRFVLAFLLIWIISGTVVVFKAASYPYVYYLFPIYPALALLAFAWLGRALLAAWMHSFAYLTLTAITICSVILLTYNNLGTANPLLIIARAPSIMKPSSTEIANPFVSFDSTKQIALGHFPPAPKIYNRPALDDLRMQYALYDGNEQILPYPFDWEMDKFVEVMAVALKEHPRGNHLPAVAIMSETEYFSSNLLEYEMRRQGIHGDLINRRSTPLWAYSFDKDLAFVITKTGPVYKAITTSDAQRFAEAALANDGAMLRTEGFLPALTLPLPDGSIGTIWQHKARLHVN